MKFIGQHIVDLIARFRSLIYLENLESSSNTDVLVVDSDGKVTKNTSTISSLNSSISANTTNIATNSSDIAVLQSSSGDSPAIIDSSGTPTLATGITAAEVRSTIGVDAAGTDNSTNVTLTGEDYLTLSGQEITVGIPGRIHIKVRNDEGSTIPAGAPLYSRGEIGGSDRIKVGIADANDSAKMPCIGIAEVEMNTSSTKDNFAISQGVYNTNISGFTGLSDGDILYVDDSGSAPYLTQNKSDIAGSANKIQNVGIVLKTNGTTCQGLLVSAIGRSNDVPNLDNDTIFIGNASNQTTTSALSSINLSSFNNDSGFTTNTGDIDRVRISTSSGNAEVTSGNADFTLSGTAPIGVTNSGTTITVAANDATTSNKGVASFNSGNFSVSSGAVDLSSTISVGNVTVDDKIQHDGDTDTFIHFGNGGNDTITLTTGNVEKLYITNSNTTFNENGNDIDFRVEGSGEANALFVQGSDGNVGIGTSTPSDKLQVNGRVISKQYQAYAANFLDDLGTTKHYLPIVDSPNEQTLNYRHEAAMTAPCDGRIASVTIRFENLNTHSGNANFTVGVESRVAGLSYAGSWTVEETETVVIPNTADHDTVHFHFANAKHFDSAELFAVSVQSDTDITGTNERFWVTVVVEWDWSTYLGTEGTSTIYSSTP